MIFLLLILWPLLSALIVFAFKRQPSVGRVWNLVSNFVWAYLGWEAFIRMPSHGDIFTVVYSWNWLPLLKSKFSLAVDGLNMPLVLFNIFLSWALSFYFLGKKEISAGFLSLFSLLNAASVGALLASDALTFYIFWEFMLIPLYFIIGKWGGSGRVYAALKFFAFTMAGSLLMLAAILGLGYQTTLPSLGWHDIAALKLPFTGWGSLQGLFFLGFLIAFLVKIPLWPLHTWLPDAHTEAPTAGSVILAGILLKLGVYGVLRWCLPLFPEAAKAAAPVLIFLSCAGIILGAFAAWRQTDIKRLIAYSSVSHMGFMTLGLFSLRPEAIQGALFQNLAHGLSTGALFLIFGIIYDRTHTRKISEYGGLASNSGILATLFVFATMASIGLPGLPGFVGEFLILSGTFAVFPVSVLVASLGILLGSIYMLSLVKRVVFGPEGSALSGKSLNIRWNEWTAIGFFVCGMLFLGVCPQRVLGISANVVDMISTLLR